MQEGIESVEAARIFGFFLLSASWLKVIDDTKRLREWWGEILQA